MITIVWLLDSNEQKETISYVISNTDTGLSRKSKVIDRCSPSQYQSLTISISPVIDLCTSPLNSDNKVIIDITSSESTSPLSQDDDYHRY